MTTTPKLCKNGLHDLSQPGATITRKHHGCASGVQVICTACCKAAEARKMAKGGRPMQTHCKRGHDLAQFKPRPDGRRRCEICARMTNAESAKRRAEAAANGTGPRKFSPSYERLLAKVGADNRTTLVLDLQQQIEQEPRAWIREGLRKQMAELTEVSR